MAQNIPRSYSVPKELRVVNADRPRWREQEGEVGNSKILMLGDEVIHLNGRPLYLGSAP